MTPIPNEMLERTEGALIIYLASFSFTAQIGPSYHYDNMHACTAKGCEAVCVIVDALKAVNKKEGEGMQNLYYIYF